MRVPYRDFTPEREKPPCPTCKRGAYYGLAWRLRDITLPEHPNALFAPDVERTNGYDVYLTEEVAQMLKSNSVKGGLLTRLLNDEEACLLQENTPAARRKVKNQHIFLT